MSRAPEPGDECRPGGACPTCNPKPLWCQGCLSVVVENKNDLCTDCQAIKAEEARWDDLLADRPSHATEPPKED